MEDEYEAGMLEPAVQPQSDQKAETLPTGQTTDSDQVNHTQQNGAGAPKAGVNADAFRALTAMLNGGATAVQQPAPAAPLVAPAIIPSVTPVANEAAASTVPSAIPPAIPNVIPEIVQDADAQTPAVTIPDASPTVIPVASDDAAQVEPDASASAQSNEIEPEKLSEEAPRVFSIKCGDPESAQGSDQEVSQESSNASVLPQTDEVATVPDVLEQVQASSVEAPAHETPSTGVSSLVEQLGAMQLAPPDEQSPTEQSSDEKVVEQVIAEPVEQAATPSDQDFAQNILANHAEQQDVPDTAESLVNMEGRHQQIPDVSDIVGQPIDLPELEIQPEVQADSLVDQQPAAESNAQDFDVVNEEQVLENSPTANSNPVGAIQAAVASEFSPLETLELPQPTDLQSQLDQQTDAPNSHKCSDGRILVSIFRKASQFKHP